MASPFQIDTLANSNGLAFSPQNRVALLGDGSLLEVDDTSATIVTVNRITNPSTAAPTIASVTTFTYGGGSTTALVADLLVIQNGASAGVDDIWIVLCSDATAGTTIEVVHGTFTQSGATFAWDTKTNAATPGASFSQTASIVWNGTNLILAYRDGSSPWVVKVTYTATKNGTAGWQTPFVLNTAANSGSHANPILRHDAKMAGGSAGATICLYTNDTSSSHSDQWAARVLLDSAANAGSANWKAEVLGGPTGQNVGTALQSATVDPANGNVHLVWNSSTAGTGAIGTSYIPVTVNSSGVPSFGTRQLVDTVSGASVAVCVDAKGRIYIFYSQAAVASNSTILYKTSDSPYSSLSVANTTVFNTAANGDNAPHVPSHDQAVSGYVPLLVQRGKTTFTSQFDNTIAAQSGGSGASSVTATDTLGALTDTAVAGRVLLRALSDSLTTLSESTARVISLPRSLADTLAAFTENVQAGLGDFVFSQTQNGISGAPSGHNSPQAETDVQWADASGNGWIFGIIPGYGGGLISARYELLARAIVNAISQTSLTTSNPDGFIHVLANNAGVFTGTEDQAFTLAEIAPAGTYVRRYYDTGTMAPTTGPALQYRVRVCIQPGNPALLFTRIDITNPSASAVTLAGADGMEVAMLGGLTTVNQGSANTNAWPGTNGKYATAIGGAETAWPGDTTPGPQAANPVYVYTVPTTNTGLSWAPFCVKQTGLIEAGIGATPKISYLGPPDATSSRVKVKVQVTVSSFPASTTKTLYFVQGLRNNAAAGEINSIAADLTQPDGAGIVSTGAFSSYSYDEGCYIIAAGSGNQVALTHTIPVGGTARWNPMYKITGFTASYVKASLGGTTLVRGVDYIGWVDTTNQVAYVKLLKQLVASGAGAGQLNNAQLVMSASNVFVVTATDTLTAISESASRAAQAYSRNGSDTLAAISENVSRLASFSRTQVDSLAALADSAARGAQALGRTASDTLTTVSGSASRAAQAFGRAASDAPATIADTASRAGQAFVRAASDPIGTLSDAASGLKVIVRTASDALTAVADNVARQLSLPRSVSDAQATLSDLASRVASSARSALDSVPTLSDAASGLKVIIRSASDGIATVSDTLARQLRLSRALVDSEQQLGDLAARLIALHEAVSEGLASILDAVTAIFHGQVSGTATYRATAKLIGYGAAAAQTGYAARLRAVTYTATLQE